MLQLILLNNYAAKMKERFDYITNPKETQFDPLLSFVHFLTQHIKIFLMKTK